MKTIDELAGQPKGSFADYVRSNPDPDARVWEEKLAALAKEKGEPPPVVTHAGELLLSLLSDEKLMASLKAAREAEEAYDDAMEKKPFPAAVGLQ